MEEKKDKPLDIWVAAQAAAAGRSHIRENLVCQDKTFVYERPDAIAFSLADGAGSAKFSHFGAETVTREVCTLLCDRFEEFYTSSSPLPVKKAILEHLLDALQKTAEVHQCEIADLASTLLAVVINKNRFLIIHIGDGIIAYTKGNEIRVASGPKNGEFANTTYFVTSSRAAEVMDVIRGNASQINGFALMSDGSGASLYSKQKREVAPVLQRLVHRLGMTSPEYMQAVLQASLEDTLTRKTFDDCSLVLAAKHIKAYDELDNEEAAEYFGIQARRPFDANKRKIRYQDILNALDSEKSSRELCETAGLKNTRSFVRTWLEPLADLGYIDEVRPGVYRRTIHPRCCFFTDDQKLNTEEATDEQR